MTQHDAPQSRRHGELLDPFDPGGHAFVWHCHILDHEDNEMIALST